MTIAITCTCGKRYKAKDQYAGKKAKCPHCHASILIPFGGDTGADTLIRPPQSRKRPEKLERAAGGDVSIRPPRSPERPEQRQSPPTPPPAPAKTASVADPPVTNEALGEPTSRTSTPLAHAVPPIRQTAGKRRTLQAKPNKKAGFFNLEKRGMGAGMLGGLLMMAAAAIWFFAGLAADIIFFYPPILFIIGIVAFMKGLVTGNVAGKKGRR